MKTLKLKPETRLERAVAKWAREEGRDYENGAAGAFKDLFYGGCASGMVGHLVYYTDTVKFYKRYKADIHALLKDAIESCGDGVEDVFGDKWDKDDPLADSMENQNLLAWFGFEEAARNVALRAGYED